MRLWKKFVHPPLKTPQRMTLTTLNNKIFKSTKRPPAIEKFATRPGFFYINRNL